MTASDHIISCDWGTSSFRLYLVRSTDGQILHHIDNGLGIKELHESWRKSGKTDKLDFFLDYLDFRIYLLEKKSGRELTGMPVLISGMASSSIGMQELPYSTLPFSLSGRDLTYRKIGAAKARPYDVYLWSGLRSDHDVMRGEESQMIGLSGHLGSGAGIVILPGTHSKHIFLEDQTITNFQTYMTGEFFALLQAHSILKNSLPVGKAPSAQPLHFEKGVEAGRQLSLLSAAFHVRTNDLLHRVRPEENFHFLSGLLISAELKNLPGDATIYLCGGGKLQAPYHRTLSLLGYRSIEVIPARVVEGAVAGSHALFWRNFN